MKKWIQVVIALGLCVQLSAVGCRSNEKQRDVGVEPEATTATPGGDPQRGGTVVFSYGGGAPRHFNPALVSGSSTAIVGAQIFASPLRYDDDWNPQPYLAESWSTSEDGLSVTLNLVEGATFHDGQPITSKDLAFSLMTVKTHHPFKPMFAPVERVDTPDAHTAVIRLARPHAAILLAMSPALLPIIPEHIYGDGQDLQTHPANLAPVGSGPFRLTEYVDGESIVLERNDDFFIPGRPYLDRIVIRLEPDPRAQVVELERQEAHLTGVFVDLASLERLSDSEHLVVTPRGHAGLGAINWLAFNLLREPLNDKRVRQAIAHAIDADFIIEHLHQGRSRRADSPIAPGSPFYEPDVPAFEVNLDKANRLLDEAGYPVQSVGARFTLSLDYIPVIPSQQRDVALYLARQLAKIGIEVQVRPSANFPEWAERIGNWDFDMTMDSVYNWGDPVIGVHRTYLSDNIRQGVVWSNTQNYRNPRVDEILGQAEMELDADKRKALYSEFQHILTDELPIVWINVLPFHTVYHAGLGNPPLSIWGVHSPLDELYWKEPPTRAYAPTPLPGGEGSPVQETAQRAITLIQERGLHEALAVFQNPGQGFLDLQASGLHVIGFTHAGIVFLDNSGQTKPGMDISGILDMKGDELLPLFLQAAKGENGGHVSLGGIWPHPATHRAGLMSAWCGALGAEDVICALAWQSQGEKE